MAGYFYQKTRRAYRSAILRYESVLKDYPDYGHMDEVLFRLGECLALAGRGPRPFLTCPAWSTSIPTASSRTTLRSSWARTLRISRRLPLQHRNPAPARPNPAPAHKLKCHFRIPQKSLD
jgi:hypothetical protein